MLKKLIFVPTNCVWQELSLLGLGTFYFLEFSFRLQFETARKPNLFIFFKVERQERPQPTHLPTHHQNMFFNGKDLGPSLKEREIEKLSPFSIPAVTSADVYRPREKEIATRTEARKRYMCDICRKSFQQVCQLKQHRRIHTGRKCDGSRERLIQRRAASGFKKLKQVCKREVAKRLILTHLLQLELTSLLRLVDKLVTLTNWNKL